MAKRYLRVEVTKEQVSNVYLCIDDEDPRYKTYLISRTACQDFLVGPALPDDLHKLALKEARGLEEEGRGLLHCSASWYPYEVKAEEAEEHSVIRVNRVDVIETKKESTP